MTRLSRRTAAFAALAGLSIGGLLAMRWVNEERARRDGECRALAKALDLTVRERSPRYLEGIVEHRWDRASGRCLAALEHHYKPCPAKGPKTASAPCAGPDADIGIYAFQDGGARPLFLCERMYATGDARCTESLYGADGGLLAGQEFPPEQFPAIKAGLLNPAP